MLWRPFRKSHCCVHAVEPSLWSWQGGGLRRIYYIRAITQFLWQQAQLCSFEPMTCGDFFSVLRLCGSRQVVAPCRADEQITQMHSLYPSLEVQKWAKSLQSGASSKTKNQQRHNKKTNTHNPHPKQHQTKTKRKREHGMTAPKSNGIKCFWISRSCTKTSRQQTKRQQRKITRRCSAKHIDQQCRNPGSPLPGSRRSHWGAFRHKTPSQ